MAETKKKPVAKKEPVKVQPELTPDQKRLLERHERREALRRKWGLI